MAKNDQGVKLQGLLRRNSQRKKYKIRTRRTNVRQGPVSKKHQSSYVNGRK